MSSLSNLAFAHPERVSKELQPPLHEILVRIHGRYRFVPRPARLLAAHDTHILSLLPRALHEFGRPRYPQLLILGENCLK